MLHSRQNAAWVRPDELNSSINSRRSSSVYEARPDALFSFVSMPEKLSGFTEADYGVEEEAFTIDNNLVENAIRPTAIGKKNFLFFGSPDSGQTSAVIYSLIETCRKLDINPSDYLYEVLDALPTMKQSETADWTPARWKSSREQTA